jgi:hypothetical protein
LGGGRELVSQEREKSGTKKYPVLGIFLGKSGKSEGEGRLFGLQCKIFLSWVISLGIPDLVFRFLSDERQPRKESGDAVHQRFHAWL